MATGEAEPSHLREPSGGDDQRASGHSPQVGVVAAHGHTVEGLPDVQFHPAGLAAQGRLGGCDRVLRCAVRDQPAMGEDQHSLDPLMPQQTRDERPRTRTRRSGDGSPRPRLEPSIRPVVGSTANGHLLAAGRHLEAITTAHDAVMTHATLRITWWYDADAGEWVAVVPDPLGEDQLVVAATRRGLEEAVAELVASQHPGSG